jgi:hypothetical protein
MSQSRDTGVCLRSKFLLLKCLSPPLSKPLRSEVLCTKLEKRSESELACSTVGLSHLHSSASRNAVHVYSFNVPEDELKSAHDLLDKEEERRAMRLVAIVQKDVS